LLGRHRVPSIGARVSIGSAGRVPGIRRLAFRTTGSSHDRHRGDDMVAGPDLVDRIARPGCRRESGPCPAMSSTARNTLRNTILLVAFEVANPLLSLVLVGTMTRKLGANGTGAYNLLLNFFFV